MNRFIEKLNTACGAQPQSMGFGRQTSSREKPRMQLVVSLSPADADRLPDLANADAVLVTISSNAEIKALEKICKTVENIPLGARLTDTAGEGIAKAAKAGCDYVISSPDITPLTAFKNAKFGRILELDTSLTEGLIRAIGDLPVDAVFVANREKLLTFHHLMLLRRIIGLAGKPVLVAVPPEITADELNALWEIGVCGVVFPLEGKQAIENLSALRKEAEKMPPSFKPQARRRYGFAPPPRPGGGGDCGGRRRGRTGRRIAG